MRLSNIARNLRLALTKRRENACCAPAAQEGRHEQDGDRAQLADNSGQAAVPISLWQRIIDKSSAVGTLTAAAGCASCFPALAALAASVGLGFLTQFEDVFVDVLIPVFAGVALTANVLSFFSHRSWHRLAAGVAGPIIVLATRYLFWGFDWRGYLFYSGLAVMLIVAIWDVLSPAQKVCRTDGKNSAFAFA